MEFCGGIFDTARPIGTTKHNHGKALDIKCLELLNKAPGREPIDHDLAQQADTWIVALRRENLAQDDLQQFAGWLAADTRHQQAWDQALAAWKTLGVISHLPVDSFLHSPAVASGSQIDNLLSRLRQRWAPVAMAFSLMLAVVLVATFDPGPKAVYVADVGEYQQINLADGSVIELNTDSAVEVSLTPDAREIVLLKGEAFFTVASDKTRPFVVDIDGASVRALGTAFNIYRDSDNTAVVTVSEGIVRVEEASGSSVSAAQSRLLTVDSALLIDSARGLSDVNVELEQVTAWRQGQLLFDNTPLPEAVRMLNRYLLKKVEVADSVAPSMRLSGTFSSRQKRQTLLAVADALELKLTPNGDKWLLSQNNP